MIAAIQRDRSDTVASSRTLADIVLRKPQSARLLSATAIERMAVVSSVTVVPSARIASVALTGLHGYKAVAAMDKTLELDGGKRVLRKQEGGRAHKCEKPLFHTFLDAAHYTAVIFGVVEFSGNCQKQVPNAIRLLFLQRHPAKVRWTAYATLCKT